MGKFSVWMYSSLEMQFQIKETGSKHNSKENCIPCSVVKNLSYM